MEILDFLSKNSSALTVIFTAVVTISTVVYAGLTMKLVSETIKMREVQTEPKIHITLEDFDFCVHIVRLNIKNIGYGPACNLTFEPSELSGEESAKDLLSDLTKSNFFKTGLRHFGPGQNIYSMYTDIRKDRDGKLSSILSFKVKYKSSTGKKYSDEIIIDMSEIKGRYKLGTPNFYAIAQSLEKIDKNISRIVNGSKRIKTDVYTRKDRNQDRTVLLKKVEEMSGVNKENISD